MTIELENFPGLYLVAKDARSKYLQCNENFAALVGLDSPAQIYGKTDYDLFPEHLAERFVYGDGCVLHNQDFKNKKEVFPRDGGVFGILTTKHKTTTGGGQTSGVIVASVDIVLTEVSLEPAYALHYDEVSGRYYFPRNINEWLTPREYDVFNCLYRGTYTSKMIAKALGLHYKTVEGLLERIKNKFDCNSKTQIIEAAIRVGVIV